MQKQDLQANLLPKIKRKKKINKENSKPIYVHLHCNIRQQYCREKIGIISN